MNQGLQVIGESFQSFGSPTRKLKSLEEEHCSLRKKYGQIKELNERVATQERAATFERMMTTENQKISNQYGEDKSKEERMLLRLVEEYKITNKELCKQLEEERNAVLEGKGKLQGIELELKLQRNENKRLQSSVDQLLQDKNKHIQVQQMPPLQSSQTKEKHSGKKYEHGLVGECSPREKEIEVLKQTVQELRQCQQKDASHFKSKLEAKEKENTFMLESLCALEEENCYLKQENSNLSSKLLLLQQDLQQLYKQQSQFSQQQLALLAEKPIKVEVPIQTNEIIMQDQSTNTVGDFQPNNINKRNLESDLLQAKDVVIEQLQQKLSKYTQEYNEQLYHNLQERKKLREQQKQQTSEIDVTITHRLIGDQTERSMTIPCDKIMDTFGNSSCKKKIQFSDFKDQEKDLVEQLEMEVRELTQTLQNVEKIYSEKEKLLVEELKSVKAQLSQNDMKSQPPSLQTNQQTPKIEAQQQQLPLSNEVNQIITNQYSKSAPQVIPKLKGNKTEFSSINFTHSGQLPEQYQNDISLNDSGYASFARGEPGLLQQQQQHEKLQTTQQSQNINEEEENNEGDEKENNNSFDHSKSQDQAQDNQSGQHEQLYQDQASNKILILQGQKIQRRNNRGRSNSITPTSNNSYQQQQQQTLSQQQQQQQSFYSPCNLYIPERVKGQSLSNMNQTSYSYRSNPQNSQFLNRSFNSTSYLPSSQKSQTQASSSKQIQNSQLFPQQYYGQQSIANQILKNQAFYVSSNNQGTPSHANNNNQIFLLNNLSSGNALQKINKNQYQHDIHNYSSQPQRHQTYQQYGRSKNNNGQNNLTSFQLSQSDKDNSLLFSQNMNMHLNSGVDSINASNDTSQLNILLTTNHNLNKSQMTNQNLSTTNQIDQQQYFQQSYQDNNQYIDSIPVSHQISKSHKVKELQDAIKIAISPQILKQSNPHSYNNNNNNNGNSNNNTQRLQLSNISNKNSDENSIYNILQISNDSKSKRRQIFNSESNQMKRNSLIFKREEVPNSKRQKIFSSGEVNILKKQVINIFNQKQNNTGGRRESKNQLAQQLSSIFNSQEIDKGTFYVSLSPKQPIISNSASNFYTQVNTRASGSNWDNQYEQNCLNKTVS